MRIACVGGGPAGLYFSILMKKAFPQVEIEVHEKNRADDTFGWGVVFSKETLGSLADADAESYRSIEDAFVYWDDIDIHLRNEVETSTGHGFCGLARKELLRILQERARSLGVSLHFGSEATVDTFATADLIIAADGVNSATREKFSKAFQPTVQLEKCKFTWLGTTLPLKAFTFIFKQTEWGLFQVHAYPFSKTPLAPSGALSTFIVECREEVWKRAGLDSMTEADSVAFLEKLFSTELKGERLCPNKSIWRTFPTITCQQWTHQNIALMGDAVHTAHFSIGSGTKLAMEDAIALAAQFKKLGLNTSAALAAWETERKVESAKIQRAARTSLEWFENADRYLQQPVTQFAFNLMTRSKRITWANLRSRDAALVKKTDEWFASTHDTARNSDGSAPPPLFAPLTIGQTTLPNRIVVSPMCQYSAVEGVPNDWHLVHLGSRAVGGAGLVITEMTNVAPEGRISHGCAGIWNDAQVTAWKRVVDFVHQNSSSKIGLQLAHAGRKASAQLPWEGGGPLQSNQRPWQTLGPSAMPFGPGWHVPKEMTRDDMAMVCAQFVAGAKNAAKAGFDVIELHGAHGYLLSSFMSPLSNQRTDSYGGSLENRMRFPLEVFEAVRAAFTGTLGIRVSAFDWHPEGQTVEDTVTFTRELKKRGCEFIDVSTAGNSPLSKPVYGRMYQVPFAEAVRAGSGLPTMTVGGIEGADHANTVLAAGRADLCALARPHLADAYLTMHHALEERADTVSWPKQYLVVKPRRKG